MQNFSYMTGDNLPLAISNSAVGTYTYGWDANKNKTSETITGAMSGFSSNMAFDDQNRLTSWNRSSGDSQAWTLSAVNDWQSFTKNGTAEARTHGPAHEVLTVGTAAIQHDSRGNMILDEFAISRTYDADGKVSQATVPAGSLRGIVGTHTYQYDALNRRVRKSVGGATPSDTIFVHTGEQITADYAAGTAAASPAAKYLWGSYIDELACRVCGAGGTTKLYPHRNQQYSTTALTDQTGAVVERYAYTAYGDLVTLDPTTLAVRTTAPMTRYTYTGREYDVETGGYHFRSRIYSATLGRFTGHDPIEYPDGANTYAGWFSQRATDPSGKAKGTCLRNSLKVGVQWTAMAVAVTETDATGVNPSLLNAGNAQEVVCMVYQVVTATYQCPKCCGGGGTVTLTEKSISKDAYHEFADPGNNIGTVEVSVGAGIPGLPSYIPDVISVDLIKVPASVQDWTAASSVCDKFFTDARKRKMTPLIPAGNLMPQAIDCDGLPNKIPNPPCAKCPRIGAGFPITLHDQGDNP